ncbi:MAG TPA: LytTR family DNA-binding domain-containing protein [Thermoanaerobaculia bacterium]|nr:LytTR family DNA-binding domain-containing protein [Thermoanaerobaculia bacterium]
MKSLSVAVVEDEPLAREHLESLVAQQSGCVVVGSAGAPEEAVRMLEERRPDLVLMDIELPGATGFDVLEALPPEALPHVIFITAYDEYAVRAFEVSAIDYLLKPVAPERLEEAFRRARDVIGTRGASDRIHDLLASRPQQRIVVRAGERVLFLRPEEIDWIESVGNYVKLHRGQESFLMRLTMVQILARLPARHFIRIQRSRIVNTDRVLELIHEGKDSYTVVLSSGARFALSPVYRRNLEAALGRF